MPKRIQRKRTKGWKAPACAVYVGRGTVWGNEYKAGDICGGHHISADDCVRYFTAHFPAGMKDGAHRVLRGHDLMCWCALCPRHADGKEFGVECADCPPCHADMLGVWANG